MIARLASPAVQVFRRMVSTDRMELADRTVTAAVGAATERVD